MAFLKQLLTENQFDNWPIPVLVGINEYLFFESIHHNNEDQFDQWHWIVIQVLRSGKDGFLDKSHLLFSIFFLEKGVDYLNESQRTVNPRVDW